MGVSQRVGILGGTFDPIHFGHLAAAQEVAWVLGLARVLFVPAHLQPLKGAAPGAAPADRAAMVRLAIAGNPLFELSTLELDRGGISYTVDTLRELRRADPAAAYWFILGMDSLVDLARWHRPDEIFSLVEVAAVHRAGWDRVDVEALQAEIPAARGRVRIVRIPGVDIASSDLRDRVRQGRPIRYLVPDDVAAYIEAKGLYR